MKRAHKKKLEAYNSTVWDNKRSFGWGAKGKCFLATFKAETVKGSSYPGSMMAVLSLLGNLPKICCPHLMNMDMDMGSRKL